MESSGVPVVVETCESSVVLDSCGACGSFMIFPNESWKLDGSKMEV